MDKQQSLPFYGPLSGTTQMSGYQKKHSPTQRPDHHPIFVSFFHLLCDPQHHPCSNCVLGSLFAQPLSTSFLVYLLVWSPPPHIPYICSPSQCRLFATHAHTIATCFAVVSILYHLFLVCLSTLSFTLTLHIHLTILISARWSATSLAKVNSRSRSIFAVARPSVVCLSVSNVRAHYSGGCNFRQFFYGIWYLGHPMTCTEKFVEIFPGEPLRRGS